MPTTKQGNAQGYDSPELNQFVEDLMVQKGFKEKLDDETFAGIKQDLKTSLERRINAVVVANLPADKLSVFEEMLDNGDQQGLQKLCQTEIPNFKEIIMAEFLNFKKTYLGV